jgi:hypothetical protein
MPSANLGESVARLQVETALTAPGLASNSAAHAARTCPKTDHGHFLIWCNAPVLSPMLSCHVEEANKTRFPIAIGLIASSYFQLVQS